MAIDRQATTRRAEALLAEGKVEEAIQVFGQLLVDRPMDLINRNKVADLCLQVGRVELGIRYLIFIADYYEADGYLAHVNAILRKARRSAPHDSEINHRIAANHLAMGQVREGISVYLELAGHYAGTGRPGLARVEYRNAERCVDLMPDPV